MLFFLGDAARTAISGGAEPEFGRGAEIVVLPCASFLGGSDSDFGRRGAAERIRNERTLFAPGAIVPFRSIFA